MRPQPSGEDLTAERLGMRSALLDVTDPDGVAQTFAEVTAAGPIDFLVNNAGIRRSSR